MAKKNKGKNKMSQMGDNTEEKYPELYSQLMEARSEWKRHGSGTMPRAFEELDPLLDCLNDLGKLAMGVTLMEVEDGTE